MRLGTIPVLLCLLLPAAAHAQALPTATPADVGMSADALERLGATLDGYVDAGKLPGGVLLVARGGQVVWSHAFGMRDREARAPMTEDAIFRIASQTKALVSVGVMMLQEEGALLITDPVGTYLPAFSNTTVAVARADSGYDVVPGMRSITIRDLLTHTSGIGYGYGPGSDRWEAAGIQGWYFADRDEPIGATVGRMADLPFEAQPGAAFVYGYSSDILGALIERVSGQPLDVFLRERITEPLGMHDTRFYLDAEQAERLAVVYSRADSNALTRAPDTSAMVGQGGYVEGPRTSFSGGAGLLSTATDYARFLQMLLNGGELDGVRLLSPATVALMTTNHIGDLYPWEQGTGFGLGFSVVEDLGARGVPGSVGEFGWGGAYHSTYWVDPAEQLVVVYLTQVIPADGLDDQGKVRAGVYAAITESWADGES